MTVKYLHLTSVFSIAVVLLLLLFQEVSFAASFSLVAPEKKVRVVVAKGEPEYVVLAARDLISDVRRITGVELSLVQGKKPRKGDVLVCTRSDESRWEAYEVSVSDGVLLISGSNPRGTMFAVYDFIERYLGVDPLSFWNDAAYPSTDRLEWEDVRIVQGPPDFKFRGWFINDEDFLTGWKDSGALRCIDYTFFNHVIAPEVMEHFAEAVVRCRYNLIIPSSFIWIANPAEEELVRICSRRGLFLTMHHQEPLGLSGRIFEQYWKEKGQPTPYSFVSSREKVEAMWRESVEGWKKYPDVIWTIGLRGVGDRAMWATDKSAPTSMEERGRIISEAMARQVEILDEALVPKENRLYETTLWLEGAELNVRGLLKFPEGTIIHFADNGPGWRWARDFRETPRQTDLKYGVYYHSALFYDGPHMVPLVPVDKMYGMMREAHDGGASESVFLNVGNVREICYNIAAGSRMLWDMDSFNPADWQADWVSRHYPGHGEGLQNAYKLYFNALERHPVSDLPYFLDGYLFGICLGKLSDMARMMKEGPDLPSEPFHALLPACAPDSTRFASKSGARFPSTLDLYRRLVAQRASYEMAMTLARKEYAALPESEQPFAYASIVYPSVLMNELTSLAAELTLAEWAVAQDIARSGPSAGSSPVRIHIAEARRHLGAIMAERAVYASGKWSGWFTYNRFKFEKIDKALQDLENRLDL